MEFDEGPCYWAFGPGICLEQQGAIQLRNRGLSSWAWCRQGGLSRTEGCRQGWSRVGCGCTQGCRRCRQASLLDTRGLRSWIASGCFKRLLGRRPSKRAPMSGGCRVAKGSRHGGLAKKGRLSESGGSRQGAPVTGPSAQESFSKSRGRSSFATEACRVGAWCRQGGLSRTEGCRQGWSRVGWQSTGL